MMTINNFKNLMIIEMIHDKITSTNEEYIAQVFSNPKFIIESNDDDPINQLVDLGMRQQKFESDFELTQKLQEFSLAIKAKERKHQEEIDTLKSAEFLARTNAEIEENRAKEIANKLEQERLEEQRKLEELKKVERRLKARKLAARKIEIDFLEQKQKIEQENYKGSLEKELERLEGLDQQKKKLFSNITEYSKIITTKKDQIHTIEQSTKKLERAKSAVKSSISNETHKLQNILKKQTEALQNIEKIQEETISKISHLGDSIPVTFSKQIETKPAVITRIKLSLTKEILKAIRDKKIPEETKKILHTSISKYESKLDKKDPLIGKGLGDINIKDSGTLTSSAIKDVIDQYLSPEEVSHTTRKDRDYIAGRLTSTLNRKTGKNIKVDPTFDNNDRDNFGNTTKNFKSMFKHSIKKRPTTASNSISNVEDHYRRSFKTNKINFNDFDEMLGKHAYKIQQEQKENALKLLKSLKFRELWRDIIKSLIKFINMNNFTSLMSLTIYATKIIARRSKILLGMILSSNKIVGILGYASIMTGIVYLFTSASMWYQICALLLLAMTGASYIRNKSYRLKNQKSIEYRKQSFSRVNNLY